MQLYNVNSHFRLLMNASNIIFQVNDYVLYESNDREHTSNLNASFITIYLTAFLSFNNK